VGRATLYNGQQSIDFAGVCMQRYYAKQFEVTMCI
jgi:hypothetical protein